MHGKGERVGTSPSSRRILKLRLLILSVGELGKQLRQLPREDMISRSTCAMMANSDSTVPRLGVLVTRSVRWFLFRTTCGSCCVDSRGSGGIQRGTNGTGLLRGVEQLPIADCQWQGFL